MDKLQLQYETYLSDLCEAIFVREFVARGLGYCRTARWRTESERLDAAACGDVLVQEESAAEQVAVVVLDDCLSLVRLSEGFVSLRMASPKPGVDEILEGFKKLLPPVEPREEQVVDIRFWRSHDGMARSSSRSVKVPSWAEIQANYPAASAESLSVLFDGFSPGRNGQLVLWHGPPGTGKTYALRALGWQWREWCRLEYVIDPEKLLTDSHYLVSVVTHQDDDQEAGAWRLLVLEDTGELLMPDAKEQTGQGLSRLLNLVDGILGQGLRLMILVTTNEPLQTLHPAVSRPGRCAAQVHFRPFSSSEAKEWARRTGRISPAAGGTLAELFDSSAGTERVPARRAIGF